MDSFEFEWNDETYRFRDTEICTVMERKTGSEWLVYWCIGLDGTNGFRALFRELTTARTALEEATRERDKYKPLAIDFGQQLNESGKRIVELKEENTRLRARLKDAEDELREGNRGLSWKDATG